MIKGIARFLEATKSSESINSDDQLLLAKKDINLLLGDKIIDVKIHYGKEGINNWLDTCITFIKLERNGIICFPFSGDEYFENSVMEKKSKSITDKWKSKIYNSKVEDIYYLLDKEELTFDDEQIAYIALDNGFILEENRMSPSGIGGADLFCKTIEEFKKEIADNRIKIYSVKTKTQKNAFD